ncbi:MAG: LTA synthase family protein [Myxococcaceae bacterium]|nr:LTA synthase family protein [Myxococcaceae bacterium]
MFPLPPSLKRGLGAGAWATMLLALACLPSRLETAIRGRGTLLEKTGRTLAGAVLDLSASGYLLAIAVGLLSLLLSLAFRGKKSIFWQRIGPLLVALPVGIALGVFAIIAEEVKFERGAFPTMFDLAEGGGNASFLEGLLGYIRYARIWVSLLVGAVLLGLALWTAVRRSRSDLEARTWGGWAVGLVVSLTLGVFAGQLAARLQAVAANAFSPAALGDPLTGVIESSVDLLQHRDAATPRDLILKVELPASDEAVGSGRMGWPPKRDAQGTCWPHPHARPMEPQREWTSKRPPGAKLIEALQDVSKALFSPAQPNVAVFQLSLESYRADDLQALNPAAARELDPFTNGLYESAGRGGSEGVLGSTGMFQAGVRTAQGLGAFTCGVGTLPYNLAITRDLLPFPLRCTGDLLREGGFHGRFLYGSDPTFDEMKKFLMEHGVDEVISQDELPEKLPKGVWSGLTDLTIFHEAASRVAKAVETGPQFAFVMSLSNHSPFTPPEDLPKEVTERVVRARKTVPNRADDDDQRRLIVHSYTDYALEHFFQELETSGLAERSIVVLGADHSTGEGYVWGPFDPETDAAKTQIPFLIVIPKAFLEKAVDRPALEAALARAQQELEGSVLSQNDVPTLLLALLSAHPGLQKLPPEARWHSMGGQVTSPWFVPGGEPETAIIGINGVSEFYAMDKEGNRLGGYEDSVFLKTRADRYRVTPRLIPIAATLRDAMLEPKACSPVAP